MRIRSTLLNALFDVSGSHYARVYRSHRARWNMNNDALCAMPEGSFGHALGVHLERYGYSLMDHVEHHDVYHLLSGIAPDVPGEVALAYFMAGNGKRSPYMMVVMVAGTVAYPEKGARFRAEFRRGATRQPLGVHDYRTMLEMPMDDVLDRLGLSPQAA